MSFTKNLNDYLLNPQKMRNKPIDVGGTPNSLLIIGAKQLPIVIKKSDIDKCLVDRISPKNKNSHNLRVDEFNLLPELLSCPVMIFKDPKIENYITVVTDKFDKDGRPFVIGVELNRKQDEYLVNRIATMHGRDRAFDSFTAKNGNEVLGFIPRNIAEGNLLAINIEKAPKFISVPYATIAKGAENFVTFNNSIPHTLANVKTLDGDKLLNYFEQTKEMEEKIMNWNEKIGQEFNLRGDENGQPYKLLSVENDYRVIFEREDSGTFTVIYPKINDNGIIDWVGIEDGGSEVLKNEMERREQNSINNYWDEKEKADIENFMNWSEKIGQEFYLRGESDTAQKYKLLSVLDDDRVVFERSDSYTFTAVNPQINDDGTVEWAYSIDGQFTDEERLNYILKNGLEAYRNNNQPVTANAPQEINEKMEDEAMKNQENQAKVTAVAYPNPNEESALKYNAIVYVGDNFRFPAKVFEHDDVNKETGEIVGSYLQVVMPDRLNQRGENVDLVIPVTKEAYAAVKTAVLEACKNPIKDTANKDELPQLKPQELDVEVGKYGFNLNKGDNKIFANCDVVIGKGDVKFSVKDASIIDGKNGKFVSFPSIQNDKGVYISPARAITAEFNEQINKSIIGGQQFKTFEHNKNAENKIGNVSYGDIPKENRSHISVNTKFLKETLAPKLDEAGVKWSGLIKQNNQTVVSASSGDIEKLKDIRKEIVDGMKNIDNNQAEKLDTTITSQFETADLDNFIKEAPELLAQAQKEYEANNRSGEDIGAR